MRFSPLALTLGLAASALSVPVLSQKPDDQITPRSVQLTQQAQAALTAGNLESATDALETALAVDPRNRGAFVTLGKVAIRQKLYGKAIRLTNEALSMEPSDRDALLVQGQAMVELGALRPVEATRHHAFTTSVSFRRRPESILRWQARSECGKTSGWIPACAGMTSRLFGLSNLLCVREDFGLPGTHSQLIPLPKSSLILFPSSRQSRS